MKYTYYTVDVFTDQPFLGVPLSVFPDAQGLTDEQMQRIANEVCTSNTVFVFYGDDSNTRNVRVFTPFKEVDLSVHTTLATSHVLCATHEIALQQRHPAVVLRDKVKVVESYVSQKDGTPSIIQQTYNTHAAIDTYTPSTNELAAMLSLSPADIGFDSYRPLIVSCGTPYLIVPIKSYHAIREAKFQLGPWSSSSAPASLAQEIFLFANNTDNNPADFHGRLLGPSIAFNDDPPIGGVLSAFANHICAHDSVQEGTHTFAVQRGANDERKSILHMEMDNKKSRDLTIRVGGTAVITVESTISL